MNEMIVSLFECKSFDQSDPPNGLKFQTFTQLWYCKNQEIGVVKTIEHSPKAADYLFS